MRSIVEGETRFSKIGNYKEAMPGEAVDLKALDLQQLFLAMTEEVQRAFILSFGSASNIGAESFSCSLLCMKEMLTAAICSVCSCGQMLFCRCASSS